MLMSNCSLAALDHTLHMWQQGQSRLLIVCVCFCVCMCPLYSPVVASFVRHIFRPPKEAVGEKSFQADEEVLEVVHAWLHMQPKDFFFLTKNPGISETLEDMH